MLLDSQTAVGSDARVSLAMHADPWEGRVRRWITAAMSKEGTTLFARTSSWSGSAEALDKWEMQVKEQVSGFVAKLPGNAGGAFFVDRASGKALTLTLWETEEAAAETDKFADQSRASTVEATGVELLERGAFEVVMRF